MITSKQLGQVKGISHAFFGRDMDISRLEMLTPSLFLAKQVHGDNIARIDASSDPRAVAAVEADALWTTERGVTLGVKTGDCVPLLVAHRSGSAVMAVHLGWRGAANGLGPKSIRHFCAELSLQTSDLVAAIGPCIGFDKFVVRSDVVDALKKSVSTEDLVVPVNETQFKVDLQGWVERQLQEVGVTLIEKIGHCTFTEADTFYSARRDAGSPGRQVSCILRN